MKFIIALSLVLSGCSTESRHKVAQVIGAFGSGMSHASAKVYCETTEENGMQITRCY
jgi:hypothetical protein